MVRKRDTEPRIVGALEKLAVAERMKIAQREQIRWSSSAKGRHVGADSQVIPVTLIFVIAVLVAMMLPAGTLSNLPTWCPQWVIEITQLFSDVILKRTTEGSSVARVVTAFAHGAGLFLMAGAPPFVAYILMRVIGRTKLDPFVAVWMTLVLVPMYFMLKDMGFFATIGDMLKGLLP